MATYIIHLADIHIGHIEYDECKNVFDTFLLKIKEIEANINNDDSLLIVIAGDVFHQKTSYSPSNIRSFYYLMGILEIF